MEILLKDGVKYNLYNYKTEDELEKIIFDNYKNIFGENTILFSKQKIITRSGIGTIPDGFILSVKEKKWYIIEVELECHPLFQHIVSQISKFSAAIKNTTSRKELSESFYNDIKSDPSKIALFRDNEIDEIYKYISDIIDHKPEIIIIIDNKNIELDDICKDLPFPTRSITFKTYCREKEEDPIYKFEEIYSEIKMNDVDSISRENDTHTSTSPSSSFPDLFNDAMKNHIFEKLVNEIRNIGQNVEMKGPQKSMVAFYENGSGLVWIDYPKNSNKIKAHLRKTDYSTADIPRDNFVQIGWGGYPEFYMNSENDIEHVIKLVVHALKNSNIEEKKKISLDSILDVNDLKNGVPRHIFDIMMELSLKYPDEMLSLKEVILVVTERYKHVPGAISRFFNDGDRANIDHKIGNFVQRGIVERRGDSLKINKDKIAGLDKYKNMFFG